MSLNTDKPQFRFPRPKPTVTHLELDMAQLVVEILEELFASIEEPHAPPLNRARLKKLEEFVGRTHSSLESATYRSLIKVNDPENKNHPLTLDWERWKAIRVKLQPHIDTFFQEKIANADAAG